MTTCRRLLSILAATVALGTSLLAQSIEIRDVEHIDARTGEQRRYLEIESRAARHDGLLFLIAGTRRMFLRLGGTNELLVVPELIVPLGTTSDIVRIELPDSIPGHVYVQAAFLEAETYAWTLSEMLDLGEDSDLDTGK